MVNISLIELAVPLSIRGWWKDQNFTIYFLPMNMNAVRFISRPHLTTGSAEGFCRSDIIIDARNTRPKVKVKGGKMSFIDVKINEGIATIVLSRGKVNSLNGLVVNELRERLKALEVNTDVKALVLTGHGKFFSFGFDIPEFLSFTQEEFTDYLTNFSDLYTYLFLYPKPVIAALNGHTIAGGCMLALACDSRVMVTGKSKISLNEIAFGSSVFAGSTEMLRFWIGNANATKVLYSGNMYSAEEAEGLGLVQEVLSEDNLLMQAKTIAVNLSSKHLPAFSSIKALLRKPVVENMMLREKASINEFVDIWYSEHTWAKLQEIKIN